MSSARRGAILAIAAAGMLCLAARLRAGDAPPAPGADLRELVKRVEARVVKLYGARVGVEKGYGSGVIVSPDGQIVTAAGPLLEGPNVRAVLADGRVFTAEVVRRDEVRQLALLKITAGDLPAFELGATESLQTGDWLMAAANPFKVADGPEPVSIATGVLAGRAPLAARRRTQDVAYSGEVLLLDVLVATPGSAGGAVVDLDGRLVGVIGRGAIGMRTNTWLNYALPAEEVASFVRGEPATAQSAPAQADGLTLRDLGLHLFDIGGRVRPAFVERVRPGSPAALAGLRQDDLILGVNDQNITSCEQLEEILRQTGGPQVTLIVKRGDAVKVLELHCGGATP